MFEEAPAASSSERPHFLRVTEPGQAWLTGPFRRVDLHTVTDLAWTPDVEEVCVRPLNSPPIRRILPRGGSLLVSGQVDNPAEETAAEGPSGPCAI